MSKNRHEIRNVTLSRLHDFSADSPLRLKQEHQSLLLMISFSAGVIAATAFMRYGYPYIYRYSKSQKSLSSRDSETEVGNSDTVRDSPDDSTLPSQAKFKARWPWDRLKNKQQPSEGEVDTGVPITVPKEMPNSPQFDTDETDEFDKNQRCCIGSIFGIDVGGTLAKLCYFESSSSAANGEYFDVATAARCEDGTTEQRKPSRRRSRSMSGRIRCAEPHSVAASPRRRSSTSGGSHGLIRRSWVGQFHNESTDNGISRIEENTSLLKEGVRYGANHQVNSSDVEAFDKSEATSMRRVQSLVSISKSTSVLNDDDVRKDDHAMALSRFYNFARRLDMYREGVRDHKLSFYCKELDGSFHFIRFETRRMMMAMDLIRTHKLHYNIHKMGGTGGGAHKFAALWQQELGITMKKQDELDSLVAGMQFVLRTVVGECYTFRPTKESDDNTKKVVKSELNNHYGNYFGVESDGDEPVTDADPGEEVNSDLKDDALENESTQGDEWWWSRKVQRDSISSDASTYPYLVVTIGTGVSVLRVDGPRQYERVSGSTIGGGTYLGLIRLLTDVEDFDDVMRLAERGDPSKVDMMVGDIYGENSDALEKLGLPSNLVASSFGKLVAKDDPAAGLKQEDLARALLLMITNNIGQVAYLNAKIFQTPRIYFVGNFLRHNHISERRLSFAINYWSKGEMEALFLEHEGYFGALGAFLLAQEITLSENEKSRALKGKAL